MPSPPDSASESRPDSPPSSQSGDRLQLAVAICTMDNIDVIERCLRSVMDIADEVLVVDSGSTDGTVELARSLGARVVHHDWEGMVGQRKFAMTLVRHARWVLLLDSDESLDPELRDSIAKAVRDEHSAAAGYEIRRMVWFLGDWLRHTFQPEWRMRLVRPERFQITGVGPGGVGGHDHITVDGPSARLTGICRHDTWRDLEHLFERQIFFGARAAKFTDRGGRVSDIVFRPPVAVFKQLVLKHGYRDGPRGFIACFGVGIGVAMKHVFIMQKKRLGERPADHRSEH
ncbi:MAG: glycosyltransferase family 2 protein [Phycisphaerales bacterium]